MTETNHMDLETLSAYADGELNAVAIVRVERHVAECELCRRALDRLRAMVATATALPREIPAPSGMWSAVRARLAETPIPRAQPARWWHNGWLMSAAAVVLVVGTVLLVPRGTGKAKGTKVASQVAAMPAVLVSVERNFAPTITELRAVFESQRDSLSPSTIRTLEHSLAVIDTAIAEARAALAAEPGRQALADMLAAYYARKVEFLKRATNLPSSL